MEVVVRNPLVLLFTLVLVVLAAPALAQSYNYMDDFTTDKVVRDHDPATIPPFDLLPEFTGSLPLHGWFMFACDTTGNRGLGFYPGQEWPDWPILAYRFPGGSYGTLEFDLTSTPDLRGGWTFGTCQIDVVTDTAAGDDSYTVAHAIMNESGHYRYEFELTGHTAFVDFVGRNVRLDNLVYSTTGVVPTTRESWGRLKALYR